jgi:hypothetical protein
MAMNKPALIRAIFAELRYSLGPDVPAGDLIRLANLILRAHTEDKDGLDEFGRPSEGQSLGALEVDKAMSDGGWRILAYEAQPREYFDDIDQGLLGAIRPLIEKYLGPEWQHQQITGQL